MTSVTEKEIIIHYIIMTNISLAFWRTQIPRTINIAVIKKREREQERTSLYSSFTTFYYSKFVLSRNY